jgi:hypothetical protein
MKTHAPKITRSFSVTFGFAVVAAVSGAATAALLLLGGNMVAYLFSLAAGGTALMFGAAALCAAWRAPCPSCKHCLAFSALEGASVPCERCGAKVESRGGRAILSASDPGYNQPTSAYHRAVRANPSASDVLGAQPAA